MWSSPSEGGGTPAQAGAARSARSGADAPADDRPAPAASVIVATYARPALVARLLGQLAGQRVAPGTFEVVVVDDGSPEPVAPALATMAVPFSLTLLRQPNGGPGSARRRAIAAARGEILIVVDDDMEIGRDFVGAHLEAHADGGHRVVLGVVEHAVGSRGSLVQRYHMAKLARAAARARGGEPLGGGDVYTGNVSFRRDDYVAAGGFDPSFRLLEDADLGIRLEQAGAKIVVSEEARALHALAPSSLRGWMPFAVANGRAAARVGAKQRDTDAANPWRNLFLVNRLTRPAIVGALLAPRLARAGSWPVMWTALGLDALRAERAAIALTTLVYGVRFFSGVRQEDGALSISLRRIARHLNEREARSLRWAARFAKLHADILADHDLLCANDAKYRGRVHSAWWLPLDALRNIGFQMMIAYRVMRWLRTSHLTPLAMVQSRLIRHVYDADLHWDADLRPGVLFLHGMGCVIWEGTVIDPECTICHHTSIGIGIDPATGESGPPHIERKVHVSPGASIIGPYTIGTGSKIGPNVVVTQSVPPRTIVAPPAPSIRARRQRRAAPPAAEQPPVVV